MTSVSCSEWELWCLAEFHRKQPIHLSLLPFPSSCFLSGSALDVGVVQKDGGGLWEGGSNLRVTELCINRNGVFRGRVILRRHSSLEYCCLESVSSCCDST